MRPSTSSRIARSVLSAAQSARARNTPRRYHLERRPAAPWLAKTLTSGSLSARLGRSSFPALGALFVDLVRERGVGWKRPAQKVQLIAINVSFLATLLATVTAVLSIRATLSRQSRRGRSFHAWLGPSGIRGTSVEPVGTRPVWQARVTGRCRPSGDI